MNNIRERWLSRRVVTAFKALPVVAVIGARQSGKTTLVQALDPHRTYWTLDDLGVQAQAMSDPHSLLANKPLTLDEVQRAPDLLHTVKQEVDRRRRNGDFLLTGSANLLLMSKVAESLAGRAVYLELAPFCPAEWLERYRRLEPLDALFGTRFAPLDWPVDSGDWPFWLLRGGFGPALLAETDEGRDLWFSGYVQTYLERDLRQLSAVTSLPDFQRLMALAANQCARLLNQSNLARDAGLTQPTCHRYLNLLETGCLIHRLQPFTTNPAKSSVKTPKLFWTDCGLAAQIAGIRTAGKLATRLDQGFWLEQTLFQTLQTWRSLDPTSRRLYFWRDRAGREVDFILEQDGKLVALEVKMGSTVSSDDAGGIRDWRHGLARKARFVRGVVLYAGKPRLLGQEVIALPWGWMVPEVKS